MAVAYQPAAAAPPDPRKKAAAIGSVLVAVFLAWQALAHRAWVQKDTRPPAWDRGTHLERALEVRAALREGDWAAVLRPAPVRDSPPLPPLYHLTLQALAGSSDPAEAALWLNWVYLALLCGALLALGVYFRPDESAAACAMLVGAAPGTLELMQSHLPDLGVMAFVALAYCALVYSEGFRRWGWSAAFGLLFALGMHQKWSFFAYLLPGLYQGLRGLEKRESRAQAAAALALGLGLCLPWYAANAAVLLPRLFAAMGGVQLSAFAGLGMARYLLDMPTALGPAFFLIGTIGLLIPQYHRALGQGWLMTAWFLSSYAFWTLVPNKQLRFIMPGLSSLALAGTGAWPKQLLWAVAAAQLLGASNYRQGWIDEIRLPTPLSDLVFFPSDPARDADWRARTALEAAAAAHQPEHPAAVLVVAADHPYLNADSLAFEARRLGSIIAPVAARSNHFDMAEFVLAKSDERGPLARLIKDRKSWFSKSYDELERWKLPDGTEAVLYQQARFVEGPLRERSADFQYYQAPESGIEAENVRLRVGPWSQERGAYATALLGGSNVKARGFDFGDVELELRDVVLAPSYGKTGALEELRVLRAGEIRLRRARLSADAVEAALEAWVPGLDLRSVRIGQTLEAEGRYRGLSVAFSAAPKLRPDALALELRTARLGPLHVPPSVLGALARFELPLEPSPEKPFRLSLPGLTPAGGVLTIP